MPKGKRKGKSDRFAGSVQTSDDESILDNGSVISDVTEVRSTTDDEVDELAQQEAFEEKLIEAVDGLAQKSAQGRTTAFQAVTKALLKKYIPEFVYERRLTVCDGIERGLRKGRGDEQAAAALLAPILCVSLEAGDPSEEICRNLKPSLITAATDNSINSIARAKCCTALGLVTFLAGGEMGEVAEHMRILETIFAASYVRGDDTVPNVGDDAGTLHAAAIGAWGLLFTLMSPSEVYSTMGNETSGSPSLVQLAGLLSSRHLDVRLAAGEALAVIFELGRDYNEDFANDYIPELVTLLRELAKDSQKFRAKKDRKQQRATFRDILLYIEEDEQSEDRIKFGTEQLILSSWSQRKQYDALCSVLGPGFNIHLAENELLRDIFELGDRIYSNEVVQTKQTKMERNMMNAAAFKARSISRGKNRDKRSDF